MASFAPPVSSRPIPPPGLMQRGARPPVPRPGMAPPRGLVNPGQGAPNPYGARPQQRPGMPSQRAITPEILSAMARRRLGG